MLKWITLPVLAVMLSIAGPPATAHAAAGYATGDVNLRTGPSTRYKRILTIPRGSHVEIYGCSGNWCDTVYRGRRGWVSGSYLASQVGRAPARVSPGAAAAGIIGLGVAGAILADRWDDDRYYHRRYPRRHYRSRHHYGPRYRWHAPRGHVRRAPPHYSRPYPPRYGGVWYRHDPYRNFGER